MRASLPMLVLVALASYAGPARAENQRVEISAKKALKAAEGDYLSMRYAVGAARLKKAAAACGQSGCTPLTKAALVCDLATMLYRKGDKADAVKAWKIAVKLSPDVQLNPAYEEKDLDAAFVAAAISPPPAHGDFTHKPPPELKVDTPLALYFAGGGGQVEHAKLFYMPPGGANWKWIPLKKHGRGWAGTLACDDTNNVGYLRYYVEGENGQGRAVASTGDTEHAFVVPIREQVTADPPSLPGQAPPRSCSDTGGPEETPPSGEQEAGNGEAAPEKKEEATGGEGWSASPPEANAHHTRRIWIGLAFGMEAMVLPSGNDVCHLDVNTAMPTDPNDLYCTALNGADFPSRDPSGYAQNNMIVPGEGGQSNGGLALTNARILLSVDYALTKNLLVGARGGVVLFTYPGQAAIVDGRASPFDRLHLEARASWLFGDDPLLSTSVVPVVFLGGGISNFSASTASTVTLNNGVTGGVDIWKTDGPGFVTAGVGGRWAFVEQVALTAALRANLAFGDGAAWTFGPEVGVAYGF